MRSRRELSPDEVDAVIAKISSTAENLEDEADRMGEQAIKMTEAATSLNDLVNWLRAGTPDE